MRSSNVNAIDNLPSLAMRRLQSSLELLLTSHEYATSTNVDRWQFAVEFSELSRSGATLLDIRWLILSGLATHAQETTVPGDSVRSFRALPVTAFPTGTCLLLDPGCADSIRAVIARQPTDATRDDVAGQSKASQTLACVASNQIKPVWDASRRELTLVDTLVKRFRVPAPNQELILAAFQEMGWPKFIDDPLPPVNDLSPKHRLQATIKSLNRNQQVTLIRFHGNGNGLQVYWEAIR